MARWKYKDPSEKTAKHREWRETDAGKAYMKKHAEYAKEWRKKNRPKHLANQKANIVTQRLKVMEHYCGGDARCMCCDEREILFLQFDHTDDSGAAWRRDTKTNLGYVPAGNNFPYWLEKNGYPDNIQVLCANCNWGRRLNEGICPHKTKAVELTQGD